MTINEFVFIFCLSAFSAFLGFEAGLAAPKVCAIVPGEKVVSSTADTCTYAQSFGLATKKRRAM